MPTDTDKPALTAAPGATVTTKRFVFAERWDRLHIVNLPEELFYTAAPEWERPSNYELRFKLTEGAAPDPRWDVRFSYVQGSDPHYAMHISPAGERYSHARSRMLRFRASSSAHSVKLAASALLASLDVDKTNARLFPEPEPTEPAPKAESAYNPQPEPKKRADLAPTCHRDGSISFYSYGNGWDRLPAAEITDEQLEAQLTEGSHRMRCAVGRARRAAAEPAPKRTGKLTTAERVAVAEAFKARADAYYTNTLGPDARVRLNVWTGGDHVRIYFNWERFIQTGGRPHGEAWRGFWAKSEIGDQCGPMWDNRPRMMKVTPTGKLGGKRSKALPALIEAWEKRGSKDERYGREPEPTPPRPRLLKSARCGVAPSTSIPGMSNTMLDREIDDEARAAEKCGKRSTEYLDALFAERSRRIERQIATLSAEPEPEPAPEPEPEPAPVCRWKVGDLVSVDGFGYNTRIVTITPREHGGRGSFNVWTPGIGGTEWSFSEPRAYQPTKVFELIEGSTDTYREAEELPGAPVCFAWTKSGHRCYELVEATGDRCPSCSTDTDTDTDTDTEPPTLITKINFSTGEVGRWLYKAKRTRREINGEVREALTPIGEPTKLPTGDAR